MVVGGGGQWRGEAWLAGPHTSRKFSEALMPSAAPAQGGGEIGTGRVGRVTVECGASCSRQGTARKQAGECGLWLGIV